MLGPPGTTEEKKLFLVDLGLGTFVLHSSFEERSSVPGGPSYIYAIFFDITLIFSTQLPDGKTLVQESMLNMIRGLMSSGLQ